MGFAIVHMQKFKAVDVRGLQIHNNRESENSRTNPDIDRTRSSENIDLIRNDNYLKSIKEKIKLMAINTKTVRKDAVYLCSFMITSDHETMKAMIPTEQKLFFEDSVKWFADRYGEDKIINATIHMDERTPHLHIGIVPITTDGKLTAKKIFDRNELTQIQTDFSSEIGSKYRLERGKEGSELTHLSEMRFKLEKTKQEIQTEKKKKEEIVCKVDEKRLELQKVSNRVEVLEKRKSGLNKHIEGLEGRLSTGKKLKLSEIDEIKPTRTLAGSLKGVNLEDIENLKATARMAPRALEDNKRLSQENSELKEEIKKLEKRIPSVMERGRELKELDRLKQIEILFHQLPEEIQNELLEIDKLIEEKKVKPNSGFEMSF